MSKIFKFLAAAMIAMGGKVETGAALAVLARHYGRDMAAE